MDSRRKGYTLAEMLTVIVILGILANIALPLLHRARTEAEATRIIADVKSSTQNLRMTLMLGGTVQEPTVRN